jgi:hypothetical protein
LNTARGRIYPETRPGPVERYGKNLRKVEEEELDAEVFHRDELVVVALPGHRLAGSAVCP